MRKGIGPNNLGVGKMVKSPAKLEKGKKKGKKDRKDYSLDTTFEDYDVMKASMPDTYAPSDTIFKSFSLDGGVSRNKAMSKATRAAGDMAGAGDSYSTRFLQPNDVSQYRTKNSTGQQGITTLVKYNKQDMIDSVVKKRKKK